MPTYQYRCTQCGHELEAVQKFTDPALTECAECRGTLRKVFNAVGVVFKGSGFYRTDSRNGNGSGAPSEQTAAKQNGSDTKSDGTGTTTVGASSGKDTASPSEKKTATSARKEAVGAGASSTGG